MTEPARAEPEGALEAFRDAEADARVSDFRDGRVRERLVQAAVGLLLAGRDGQALRELAVAERADAHELEALLGAALLDLGLGALDPEAAAHRVAERAAAAYLTGMSDADEASAAAWEGYRYLIGEHTTRAEDAQALSDLAMVADGVLDMPEYVGERDLWLAARHYLEVRNRLPPEDRLRPMPPPLPAPVRRRPPVDRIGMAVVAAVLAALLAVVGIAAFMAGAPFLGVMGLLGMLVALLVGALTLRDGP